MLEARGPRALVEKAGEVLPKTTNSVLLSLRLRKFAPIHALISARQSRRRWSAACPSALMGIYSWMSSAKQWKEILCFARISPQGKM